jgi:hypothetical protein
VHRAAASSGPRLYRAEAYPKRSGPALGGSSPPAASTASTASTASPLGRDEDVVAVDDLVGVPLLGQEALPPGREVLVVGVASDDGEEVGLAAVRLGAQDPAEPLRLLLAAPERARDLDRHRRLGQVDREVGHLGDDQQRLLAEPEGVVEALTHWRGRPPGDERRRHPLGDRFQLVEVLADHECGLVPPRRLVTERLHHRELRAGGRTDPVALLGFGHGVGQPLLVGEGHPDLGAPGGRDPSLRLDVAPRGVVALGADEREDVALAAVLPDERGRQPQAPAALDLGGHAEDRRREEMDLVVDDQAPVLGPQEVDMGVRTLPAGDEDLVGRERHRPDLLALARVLADLVFAEARAGEQLAPPLPGRDRVGDEDQRAGAGAGHRGQPDQRLPRAAGEHDHSAAGGRERVDRLHLVGPQGEPGVGAQRDRVGGAGHVAGPVVRRPAGLEQRLLEPAPFAAGYRHRRVVDARADERSDRLGPQHLLEDGPVGRAQDQAVHRVHLEDKTPVARHHVGDVEEERLRDGVAGPSQEGVDDAFRVEPGGSRVPEPERGDAVGVHVLG